MRISTALTKAPTKRRINRLTLFFISASALCLLTIAGLLMWQYKLLNPQQYRRPPAKETQVSLAGNATFGTISPDDQQVKDAVVATDLAKAKGLLDQQGAFTGTVSAARSSAGNGKVVLDFAAKRETAMRAVIKVKNFSKFPKLEDLVGKKVLVLGIFAPHDDRAEIELTEPEQLKIVG